MAEASESFGDRLRRAMKAKRVRNPAVAEATGVHLNTVSQWLGDRFPPTDDKLAAIAKLLGVSVGWLRYGDGEQKEGNRVRESPQQLRIFGGLPIDFDSPTAAQKGRIWVEQFLLELLESGADSDFVAWARRFLMSTGNYVLYVGGTEGDMNDEQKLRHMEALGVGVRAILKDRLKKKGK